MSPSVTYNDLLRTLSRATDHGNYIKALCPFHPDHEPSMLVYRDGFFVCLSASCGRHGSWTQLWNKVKGQPIQIRPEGKVCRETPAAMLTNGHTTWEDLTYQAHLFLTEFSSYQYYLETRGLADAVERHELGYWQGWFSIPVHNRDGNYQATIWRAAPHIQRATGQRYYCQAKPPVIYVPDWRLVDKSDYVLVVYGALDALTLDKLRYPVVTSTAGARQFDPSFLDDWHKPIYILPDKGEERTALELACRLDWRGHVLYLNYPEGAKDANDFLQQGREQELRVQLQRRLK